MNNDSRTKNSVRNAISSVIFEIINVILAFVVRTVFIYSLSSSYLGVNGLFTNILSLLSLADLGFDTAIIYSLYKPIAANDKDKIAALMNYFKKVYNVIGCLVFCVGILIIPFLKYIINLENAIGNIYLYYFLFLLNTSITYFLANRVAIINADQKMYVVKRISFIFSIIQSVLQCIVLLVFKNYILFLLIQISSTLLKNIFGAIKAKKMYPFIHNNKNKLSKKEKKDIFNNTKSFMIYKIGSVILTDTDNILISALIMTEVVGIYSNYTIIITAFTTIITLFFTSSLASIGNLNTEENTEKQELILYRVKFLSIWIYGMVAICLFCLINDFIGIMWGKEYVMSILIPIAALINFMIFGILQPFRLYRETTSAFKDIKNIYIYTSILNLIFSYILAKIMPTIELKLFGITIATAIAKLMTNYWFEPKKIFNVILKKSSLNYFVDNLKDIIIVFAICFISFLITKNIIVSGFLSFLIKALVCFIITNLLFLLFYRKDNSFLYFKNMVKNILKKNT